MTVKEANEALDRLFDYCEEIDNHIPEEERTGYDMLPDIQALRKFVSAENKGFEGMTYREVIFAIFPNASVHELGGGLQIFVHEDVGGLDSPYKEVSE